MKLAPIIAIARNVLRSRAVKLSLALAMLAALYAAADWRAVGQALARLDPLCLGAALSLFVPQTLLSAARWRGLTRDLAPIGLREAVRQTLAASALNLVAPSKLGDLSKAAMLPRLTPRQRGAAMIRAVSEKGGDVAALAGLLLWGLAGWSAGWLAAGWLALCLLTWIVRRSNQPAGVVTGLTFVLATLALWALHLAQIDLFLKAAGVFVPCQTMLARVPVAVFAGLLPVSFCGLGTRDAALVWLFADVADAPTMAAVGLLTALRYLAPGAVGIPLLGGGPNLRFLGGLLRWPSRSK
jgi:hypothetical protein